MDGWRMEADEMEKWELDLTDDWMLLATEVLCACAWVMMMWGGGTGSIGGKKLWWPARRVRVRTSASNTWNPEQPIQADPSKEAIILQYYRTSSTFL